MPARILLVDDSPTILNMLGIILRQQGFAVNTAGDGMEALKSLAADPVDLMITDVNMPRMDGFTLIARVRAQAEYQNLPIIVLSTENAPNDVESGMKRGADLYLGKPVPPQVLVDNVRKLLG